MDGRRRIDFRIASGSMDGDDPLIHAGSAMLLISVLYVCAMVVVFVFALVALPILLLVRVVLLPVALRRRVRLSLWFQRPLLHAGMIFSLIPALAESLDRTLSDLSKYPRGV